MPADPTDPPVVLDAHAVARFAERSSWSVAMISALRSHGSWPPTVPSAVLVECLTGAGGKGAVENRFLKTCDVVEVLPERLARRAARLRTQARRGSAIDALVVATAEPGGTVFTSDRKDLRALAARADKVSVEYI